jgi:E3 ubiquitin-protein ligase TRIP12
VSADGVFDHKGYTEKSLARMVKAKAKADRAAARQATSGAPNNSIAPPPTTVVSLPARSSPVNQYSVATDNDSAEPQTQDVEEALPLSPPKESTVDRTDLLRCKPAVVGRFMQLMVPILVDVYAASVITPVRVKTLTGLLKAVSFLDGDSLKRVLTVWSFFFYPS